MVALRKPLVVVPIIVHISRCLSHSRLLVRLQWVAQSLIPSYRPKSIKCHLREVLEEQLEHHRVNLVRHP